MKTNRRNFILKTFGIIALSPLMNYCITRDKNYLILSASHSDKNARDKQGRDMDPYMAIYDSRTDLVTQLQVPSYVHGIVQSPADPMEFLCLPKLGKTGFIYNHQTGAVRAFNSEKGFLFYGHGSFSEDGKYMYIAQSIDSEVINSWRTRQNYRGSVKIWDTQTLSVHTEFDSYGNDPHDMKLMGRDRIIVANGGQGTNVSVIDLVSRKLIEQYTCDIEGIACRHLVLDKNKNLFVLTAVQSGKTHCRLLFPENGKLVPFRFGPENSDYIRDELLSGVATDDHIITTTPATNAIQVWDKKEKSILKVEEIEEAAGLTLSADGQHYLVTSGYENPAIRFAAGSNIRLEELSKLNKLTGRHTLLALV